MSASRPPRAGSRKSATECFTLAQPVADVFHCDPAYGCSPQPLGRSSDLVSPAGPSDFEVLDLDGNGTLDAVATFEFKGRVLVARKTNGVLDTSMTLRFVTVTS